MTVAALYVDPNGVYAGLDGVEVWDEARDARWCQLASVNEARWGAMIGDDGGRMAGAPRRATARRTGGCFAAALHAVRTYGGVLEHPAYSLAWARFALPRPGRDGWTSSLTDHGYSCELSQSAYGHPARKRTWLYAIGCDLPALHARDPRGVAVVGAGIHSGEAMGRGRVEGYAASRTPESFRDLLLEMARSAA